MEKTYSSLRPGNFSIILLSTEVNLNIFLKIKILKIALSYLNNKYYLDLYDAARVVLKSFGVSFN